MQRIDQSQITRNQAHEYQRPELKDPLSNKIKRIGAIFFLGLAYLIFFPVTLSAGGYRLYTHFANKELKEDLAAKRYQAACEFVQRELESDYDEKFWESLEKEKGISSYVKHCEKLLSIDPKKVISGYQAEKKLIQLRKMVNDALASPIYQKNKGKNNPFIKVVPLWAHALTAEAEGMKAFQTYGKNAIGKISAPTYTTLANTLDKSLKKQKTFNKDSHLSNLFWIFAHPHKALAAGFDNLKLKDPIYYNSYVNGNQNVHVGTFSVGKNKMHLSLGPTPTCDRLFLGHLDYLRSKNQKRFQQDLESTYKKGERIRIHEKERMANAYEDILTYLRCPLDGKLWKSKSEDFFSEIATEMESEFRIPRSLQKNASELLSITQESVKNVKGHNKAKLLAFNTALAVQAILKTAQRDAYMGQACKQDIDRGVLLNVMTILFFDALGNKPLTEKRVQQIVGIVLGRAGIVDDRKILKGRYEALSDLLHIIAKDPEAFFAPYKKYFKRRDVSFSS